MKRRESLALPLNGNVSVDVFCTVVVVEMQQPFQKSKKKFKLKK
jgi:hypothetical protein